MQPEKGRERENNAEQATNFTKFEYILVWSAIRMGGKERVHVNTIQENVYKIMRKKIFDIHALSSAQTYIYLISKRPSSFTAREREEQTFYFKND